MKELIGPSNKVLEVDLSSEKVEIYRVTNGERQLYLGGKGLGLKLLFDRLEPGIDPLSEDNIIAFMPGVLAGTGAPCSGRFAAVTKSPLTRIMASATCGGPFGIQLKTAGWDGLLIKGKASRPTYLEISSTGVKFKNAEELWGNNPASVQEKIGNKKSGILVIGVAGENLVKFANIVSGHRFLGRTGMGAVMGSKKLKAVVVNGGDYRIRPTDKKKFTRVRKKANRYIQRNKVTSHSLRNYGTPFLANIMNKGNLLTIKNFITGFDVHSPDVSGEKMREKHKTEHYTCKPCSILCSKKGDFNGQELVVPEFQTVALLGTNIGVFDSVKIAEWNQICSEVGMDTISTGNTLSWVMEATEKGLVESDLKFGSSEKISKALYDIAYLRGFGKDMAQGVRALSQKYGGEDFAMHVKGLEMSAYDSRGSFGQGLAYAVANRGACHLSAYIVGLEILFSFLKPDTIRAKANFTKFFESVNSCINSLNTCLFTLFAFPLESPLMKYTPKPIIGFFMQNLSNVTIKFVDFSIYTKLWSAVTGIKISNRNYLKAGDRIHVLERYMNTREGISKKDDTLPPRLLKEWRLGDPDKRKVPLEKMLDKYYKLRGYDGNGIPTGRVLRKLKIIAS